MKSVRQEENINQFTDLIKNRRNTERKIKDIQKIRIYFVTTFIQFII